MATPAPPAPEPIPFPLKDEELAELMLTMGALFAEQEPFEGQVAMEIMKSPAVQGSITLNEANTQLAAMAQGKGLHPLPTPEAFVPMLEQILDESPSFAAAFPNLLKSLIGTAGIPGLVFTVMATKDPRYAVALRSEEAAEEVVGVARQAFPSSDPDEERATQISVRKAALDQWPQLDNLPTKEKALIVALLLGLASQGSTESKKGQEAKDLMREMAERLEALRQSVQMAESALYSLNELDGLLKEWREQKEATEAEGNTWVPPTIRKIKGSGVWEMVDEPKVIPKGAVE
jgi:hypothetical protein